MGSYVQAVTKLEWEKALCAQHGRLRKKRYAGLLRLLDYDSFLATLAEEDRRYRQRHIARYMDFLSPALKHLDAFTRAFTTMSAASPEIAGVLWGGIQIVMVMASKFIGIMGRITEMIKDLTEHLTRLHRYLELFPSQDVFQSCLNCIVQHYVGFCISALKFFKRCPTYSLIRMLWTALDHKFENARDQIVIYLRRFDSMRQYVVEHELVTTTRRIAAAIPPAIPIAATGQVTSTTLSQLYEVPYTRNVRFCGRREVLHNLHELLVGDKGHGQSGASDVQQPRSCVVHGMGGVGKTQIAIEYTYLYRTSYDFILWISAENKTVLGNSVARICASLGLQPPLAGNVAIDTSIAVESLRKWLENTGPNVHWLLVFDNAESWSTFEPCLPRTDHGAILITSQHDQLCALAAHDIHLEPLNNREGSELILKHLPKTEVPYEVEHAERISAQLGGLPLALGYVAGYISNTKWSMQEFLRLSEKRQISASIFSMPPPTTTYQYEMTLAMVWEVSSRRLEPSKRRVIQILSMLDPDGTPENMLYADHQEPELAFLSSSNLDVYGFSMMIGDLASRHLIRRETVSQMPLLLIHRSLQKSVLHDLDKDPGLLQETFDMTFTLVRKVYPRQSPTHDPQNSNWETQKLYQPLVLSLLSVYNGSAAQGLITPPAGFAELLSDAAYYSWESATVVDGLKLTDSALAICKKYPPNSYVVHSNVYALGGVMHWGWGMTQRKTVLHRFLVMLSLLQRHINRLDADAATSEVLRLYATSWNDIGHVLVDHEFYEDGIRMLDLCATIKGRLGDEMGVWGANRNKALALAWSGRVTEAAELVPHSEDQVLPELLAPSCASYYERCRFAWANILAIAGDLPRACSLLQKNLESRRALHGETGHYTLDSYFLLGVVYRKMGNVQEAVKYFKKALQTPENWSEEAQAVAKHHLSQALGDLGGGQHDDEAQKLSWEAKSIRERLWGPHSRYLRPLRVGEGDDDETFDHLACCEMGRMTAGRFQASGKLPRLMQLCRDIQARLDALGEGRISAAACCRACKGDEVDTSEAETTLYEM